MKYTFDMSGKRKMIENHMNLGGKNDLGEEINLNSLYFTKNGKPWIPIMAECHFSRLHKKDWEREILKIKAGGITVIATYLFWIYHEETEGVFDFSGDNDIKEFLRLCTKHDMRVVLRIGPWAHGEARNGGFPDWLINKGIKLRNNNEEYLTLVRKWYKAVYDEVKDYLFDKTGTVPMIQLENELVNAEEHILKLKEIAIEIGLKAPIYTATGWNSIYGAELPTYEIMPVFGGYPEAPWTAHTRKLQPSPNYFFTATRNDSAIGTDLIPQGDDGKNVKRMDYNLYPFATCELGGGMCVTHHRRPIIEGDDVSAVSLTKLGCGNNLPGYYMYHGGTNKIGKLSTYNETKATGYPNDYPILSYDFQAPIGEYGLIRPHYREFKIQHLFINDFMELLAPMDAYMSSEKIVQLEDTEHLRYAMRMKDDSGFVFVNNYQRITDMGDKTDVQFAVPMSDGEETVFPEKPITVKNGEYFALPFNINLNGVKLKYSTTQLLCRQNNTFFFFAVDGIEPEYVFENNSVTAKAGLDGGFDIDGVHIVTITREQAQMMYRFGDRIYIGGGDMYCDGENVYIYAMDKTDLSYSVWNDEIKKFDKAVMNVSPVSDNVKYTQTNVIDFNAPEKYSDNLSVTEGIKELFIGGAKSAKQWKLELDLSDCGYRRFLNIDYVGDVAQLYADGKLVADEYYIGRTWIVDTDILKDAKEILLVISELDKQDVYFETDKVSGCDVNGIDVNTEYFTVI